MTTFEAVLSLIGAIVAAVSGISQAILHTKANANQTAIANIQAATAVATVAAPLVADVITAAQPVAPAAAQPALTDVSSALGRIESLLMAFQKGPGA